MFLVSTLSEVGNPVYLFILDDVTILAAGQDIHKVRINQEHSAYTPNSGCSQNRYTPKLDISQNSFWSHFSGFLVKEEKGVFAHIFIGVW